MRRLFIIIPLFIFSCSNDDTEFYDSPNPYDFGWVKATRNGQHWEAHPFGTIRVSPEGHFSLIFSVYNEKGFKRQNLGIQEIPLSKGSYEVHHGIHSSGKVLTFASFATALDDGDVVGDFYGLDTLNGFVNTINISEYDSSTHEVTGTFNLSFLKTREHNPASPESLRFENGEFYTKILREEDID